MSLVIYPFTYVSFFHGSDYMDRVGEGGGAQFKNVETKIPIFINVDIAKNFNLYPAII